MLASELNRYIEIWDDTNSIDDVGAPIKTFEKVKSTYASVRQTGGGTSYDEYKETVTWITDFYMRWDSRVKYGCQIKYNDEFYIIENIEVLGRNEGLKISTQLFKTDE